MIPMTNRRDAVAACIVLAVSVVFLVWAQEYPRRLGIVPSLVAWAAIALSLLDLAAQTETRAGRVIRRFSGQGARNEPEERERSANEHSEAVAMLWPVGYTLAVVAFGFLVATPAYVFLYMWLHGAKPLRSSVLGALVTTLAIWLTFQVLFRYPLYQGVVFGGAL